MADMQHVHPSHEDRAWMAVAGLSGVVGAWIAPDYLVPLAGMWVFMLVGNLVLGYVRRER